MAPDDGPSPTDMPPMDEPPMGDAPDMEGGEEPPTDMPPMEDESAEDAPSMEGGEEPPMGDDPSMEGDEDSQEIMDIIGKLGPKAKDTVKKYAESLGESKRNYKQRIYEFFAQDIEEPKSSRNDIKDITNAEDNKVRKSPFVVKR